jgi:hypothetical protein
MFVHAIFPMSCDPVYKYIYIKLCTFLVKVTADVMTIHGIFINV